MADRPAKGTKTADRFSKINLKRFLRDSILLSLLNCAILLLLFYYGENNILKVQRQDLEREATAVLEMERNLLGNEFDYVISDMEFLIDGYHDQLENRADIENTAEEWIRFSNTRKVYDQVRFLNTQGKEVIRINYSEDGAYAVYQSMLQDKSDRYYFTDTIVLDPEQIYISKMDLNVEGDIVEYPFKPMLRICQPVYNSRGVLQGIIVLNYKAENILRDFKSVENINNAWNYLLNINGYWLASPDPNQEWGFMFETKKDISFTNSYPAEWAKIQENDETDEIVIFYTENGMFAHTHIRLTDKLVNNQTMVLENRVIMQNREWILVLRESQDGAHGLAVSGSVWDIAWLVLQKYLLIFIVFIVASFLITYVLGMMRRANERIAFYSMYDPLTGVFNRRAGLEKLQAKMDLPERRGRRIVLIFADVNGLKEVNDTFGHDAGDALILAVSQTFKANIRKEDYIVRLGGDEFLMVLTDTSGNDAEIVWQRIISQFDAINQTGERPYLISVSHGLAAVDDYSEESVDNLVKLADAAMYDEKRRIKEHLDVIRRV